MNAPIAITPTGPLEGAMVIPGSKSLTNRALVCAALAQGESILVNPSDSEDTVLMQNALDQMGVLARMTGRGLEVEGGGGRLSVPKLPIPVGNAGTTLRFLLSLAALAPGRVVFEGAPRMAERPNEDLIAALGDLGVLVEFRTGIPTYVVHGGILRGGTARVHADKSSQFLSSLLLCAPYAATDVLVTVEGSLTSAPYVAMTAAVMRHFGVQLDMKDHEYHIRSGQRYKPAEFEVEADASGASYAFGAAAIAGGAVTARRVRRDSLQGDIGFVGLLEEMGCVSFRTAGGLALSRTGPLRGIAVDMNRMPDVVPTLAAVALFADSPTRIRNVAHLRHKESDRLGVLAAELRKFGALITEYDDGLGVVPSSLHGAAIDPHGDHRMAMACALVGLRVPGVVITDPGCVRKSFPQFWGQLGALARAPLNADS
jgi:3-phosphoshikimate 1-carboxyvinyltransferase